MNNKFEAAYILGQRSAMEKVSNDRGGLTYNPTYSQSDIDAIRRYNRDVASGTGQNIGLGSAGAFLAGTYAASRAGEVGKLNNSIDDMLVQRNNRQYSNLVGNRKGGLPNLQGKIDKSKALLNDSKYLRGRALGNMYRHKGKLGLAAAGVYGLGRLMGYGGTRTVQGFNNYVNTDLNSQDRR
jgi:hypothetical protein